MSEKNSKLEPLEVVKRYYQRYMEYKEAFDNDPKNTEDTEKQIKKILDDGVEPGSKEFFDRMTEVIVERSEKVSDVNNAAIRFLLFTDFFLLTQEGDLPNEILEEHNKVPIKENIKQIHSISNGKFERNEKRVITAEMKEYFTAILDQIS